MEYREILEMMSNETPVIEGDVDLEMKTLRECLENFFDDTKADGIDRDTAVNIAAQYVTTKIMETKHPIDKFFLYVFHVVKTMSEQINTQHKEA